MLLGIVTFLSAQNKGKTFVKAVKYTYMKTNGGTDNSTMYVSTSNSLLFSSEIYKEVDNNVRVTIQSNKILCNIIKSTIINSQLKSVNEKERLTIVFLFDKLGNTVELGFILPNEMNASPKQIEILEEQIKKKFKVTITSIEPNKKYTVYGLTIPLSKILDSTYPY
jgi:hypothetical protein